MINQLRESNLTTHVRSSVHDWQPELKPSDMAAGYESLGA